MWCEDKFCDITDFFKKKKNLWENLERVLLQSTFSSSRWSCKTLFQYLVGVAFALWESHRGRGFQEREREAKKNIKKTKKGIKSSSNLSKEMSH